MITLTLRYSQYLNDTAVGNIEQWSKDWFSYLLRWYILNILININIYIYIYKLIKNKVYK